MAQEFGKRKYWMRLIKPMLLYVVLLAAPFSIFMVFVAVGSGTLRALLLTLLGIGLVTFLAIRHLHSVYTFPLIKVDGSLIAVMEPMFTRKVFERARVTRVILFRHVLLFLHNGWPMMVSLWELSSDEREQVVDILRQEHK